MGVNRWTNFLLNALASLADSSWIGDQQPREFTVDLNDDASVRAAFRAIIEWEWGPRAFQREQP